MATRVGVKLIKKERDDKPAPESAPEQPKRVVRRGRKKTEK